MKKIDFIVATLFFTCAVAFTVYIIVRFNEINDIARLIATTICFYFTAAVYAFLGFKISQHQKYTLWMHEGNYRKLKNMYEEIIDSDTIDTLTVHAFCSGVHEFGILTFDIETGSYPKDIKENADAMLDDLMNCMAQITVKEGLYDSVLFR